MILFHGIIAQTAMGSKLESNQFGNVDINDRKSKQEVSINYIRLDFVLQIIPSILLYQGAPVTLY